MAELICNLENKDIPNDEFTLIEQTCKKQGHIGGNENLRSLIDDDLKMLRYTDIHIDSIKDFLEKIKLHFDCTPNTISHEIYSNIINEVFSRLNTKKWIHCETVCKKIFNDQLVVVKIIWSKPEMCPFKSILDEKYRGSCYGSDDYIFIKGNNDYLHISSLLMHQIEKHNFFQGINSPYRVSPIDFINFFNIKPNTDYKTNKRETVFYVWYTDLVRQKIQNDIIREKYVFDKFEILKCESKFGLELDTWIHFFDNIEQDDILHYDDSLLEREIYTYNPGKFLRLAVKIPNYRISLTENEIQHRWI